MTRNHRNSESRSFRRLVETASKLPRETVGIDYFIQDLYRKEAAGLSDRELQRIEEVAQARRPATFDQRVAAYNKHLDLSEHAGKALGRFGVQPRIPSLLPDRPRHLPSPEVRQARRQRRYGLERGGRGVLVPPHIAAGLTPSEVAVLTVIAIEINRHGFCDLYMLQIGTYAGCGERTARAALRRGEKLGLVNTVQRREGRFNKTNIVTATPLWSPWLTRRQAWKNNRHFSSGDPSSSPKKENKEKEKGSAGTQGASSAPSSRPIEPPTKPVIVTDLRSAQEKAKDDAWFERVMSVIPRR